ncbi:MAG TPA: methyltransferase domain-containing protein [Polyangiaceae bacterium]|jgi:SAM-dependent methyltransferase|nr:methyltransferase domain-containing protein [Polyangiaceae bacterium]
MPISDSQSEQIASWNGHLGERWVRQQPILDRAFAPFAARLMEGAGPRPGQHVLDLGCGTGTTTLATSEAVGPTGRVVGVDVSAPMVDRARERAAGRPHVAFVLADASAHRFAAPDAPFDLAISRFGVMFFGDPTAAFANVRSALRPGASLVFVCWRSIADNEWVRMPYELATQHVAPPPRPGPEDPGPFSFGDPARVRRILDGAGFSGVSITPFDAPIVLSEEGLEPALDFLTSNGPAGRLLSEAPDDAKARVREALRPRLQPFTSGERVSGHVSGHVTIGGAVWLVSASTGPAAPASPGPRP